MAKHYLSILVDELAQRPRSSSRSFNQKQILMRIAFDAKRAFLNFTGLGNYSRFVLDALSEHEPDHEYLLYTPRTSGNPEVQQLIRQPNIYVRTPSKMVSRLGMGSLWRSYMLGNVATSDGADVLHGLSNELPFIGNKKMKRVVTIHDLLFIRYPHFYKRLDVEIYKRKFKHACKVADIIIAVSEQTSLDIQEFLGVPKDKIKVVYQGCHSHFRNESDVFTMRQVADKYSLPDDFMLTVGTIESRKNALLILQALNALKGKLDLPLVIVGKATEYKRLLMDYIQKHQLQDRVIFLHQIDFHELPSLYQLAKLFIYPSFFEGFGIPIVEALNAHVPVIATKGSCLQEAGGPDSLYVDPHRPDELAEAIGQVLNNPALATKMIEHGDSWVKQFEPQAIAADLMRVYKAL